jgi:hypothetical protein
MAAGACATAATGARGASAAQADRMSEIATQENTRAMTCLRARIIFAIPLSSKAAIRSIDKL